MKKILLITILAVLLCCNGTLAFQNEPDGFRGLKWGDPPTVEMVYYSKGDWYTRRSDRLEIGGAKLENIYYIFYKEKFMKVLITTEDSQSLKDVLILKFGEPQIQRPLGLPVYKWLGDVATIRIFIVKSGATLTIYSTKIHTQREENAHREEEEEARRKEEERQKAAEEGLADF